MAAPRKKRNKTAEAHYAELHQKMMLAEVSMIRAFRVWEALRRAERRYAAMLDKTAFAGSKPVAGKFSAEDVARMNGLPEFDEALNDKL
jgi:hypothetical protein